jgi:hypothetical protein
MKSVSSGIRMNGLAVVAGMFCLALTAVASAQQQGAKPCADDAARLCKDVQPGQGNIARCLKQHSSELSPACQENIAKAKEQIRNFREACKDDMQKLCAGVQRGGGRIIQCMKQHEAELSPACKAQMDQHRGQAAKGS